MKCSLLCSFLFPVVELLTLLVQSPPGSQLLSPRIGRLSVCQESCKARIKQSQVTPPLLMLFLLRPKSLDSQKFSYSNSYYIGKCHIFPINVKYHEPQ